MNSCGLSQLVFINPQLLKKSLDICPVLSGSVLFASQLNIFILMTLIMTMGTSKVKTRPVHYINSARKELMSSLQHKKTPLLTKRNIRLINFSLCCKKLCCFSPAGQTSKIWIKFAQLYRICVLIYFNSRSEVTFIGFYYILLVQKLWYRFQNRDNDNSPFSTKM